VVKIRQQATYCSIVKNFNIREPNKELKRNKIYTRVMMWAKSKVKSTSRCIRELLRHQKRRRRSQGKKEYPYQPTKRHEINTESIGQCRAFSIEIDLDSCVPKASESKLIVLNALALAQKESSLVGIWIWVKLFYVPWSWFVHGVDLIFFPMCWHVEVVFWCQSFVCRLGR